MTANPVLINKEEQYHNVAVAFKGHDTVNGPPLCIVPIKNVSTERVEWWVKTNGLGCHFLHTHHVSGSAGRHANGEPAAAGMSSFSLLGGTNRFGVEIYCALIRSNCRDKHKLLYQ